MATSYVTETKIVNRQGNSTDLKITVGYAQAGGSYVVLISPNGVKQEIQPNANGTYTIPLQKNCILSCVSTVQDINLSTNNTSVAHDFTSVSPTNHNYSKTVDHHNDKVIYDIQYIFT
jgi:hypothetical protein